MRLPLRLALLALPALFACGPGEAELFGLEEDDEFGPIQSALGAAGLPPHGFHTVVRDEPYAWDSILALAQGGAGPIIASQNRPDSVPHTRWTRHIHDGHFPDGVALAEAIHQAFSDVEPPLRVMIDELSSDSIGKVAQAAKHLRKNYPQYRGRWGAYVVYGTAVSYARLNPAIDALLDAGAAISVEMYPHQSAYCASGRTSAERDRWLAAYFRGGEGAFPQARFKWLAERRRVLGSDSHLSVLFGVTDRFADGRYPSVFIDRMFYVWANLSRHRGALLIENGGPGAWKWDLPFMSNTSRDLAFAESLRHYSIQGKLSSRLGAVRCD